MSSDAAAISVEVDERVHNREILMRYTVMAMLAYPATTIHKAWTLAESRSPSPSLDESLDARFARALKLLRPMTHDHPVTPVEHSFTWTAVSRKLHLEDEGTWFLVVFRSKRLADADSELLYEADSRAHIEALDNGHLLGYYFGDLDSQRRCLAMCVWDDREAARRATHQPLHRKAARLAASMYESFTLDRFWLTKERGRPGFKFCEAE